MLFLSFGFTIQNKMKGKKIKPPIAKIIKRELVKHGHIRIDNYFWLRDRKDPEVINYLKAENSYLKESLKHTEKFQKDLFDEIVGRIKKDDTSVPYKKNGYFYYTRYEKGKEYPIYCRKKESMKGKEEVLLNVNNMAKGYKYFHVTGLSVSPDNKKLSYGVDTVSRRKYSIFIKNLETGKIFPEKIINSTGRAVWANDNKTIFYTKKDKTLRAYKIFRHLLKTKTIKDKEIYHEKDSTFSAFAIKTKSDKYIMILSYSTLSTEYRFIDASIPMDDFKIIHPRENDLEYSVDHYKNNFYIKTNYKAKNFRLMSTPVTKTSKSNWKEIIPHRKDVFLSGFELFQDNLVLSERKNGLINLRVIRWKDKSEHYLDFGEEAYAAYISYNPEFNTRLLRYGYSSMTTPDSTYDYDMGKRTRKLLKQQEVIGDFKPENYKTERHYAKAKDGTKIPISLVYRKGIKKDGENPLLLYAYGSYGASMNPYFSSVRLSLLDRGFVYAIAHIRGGQEMGRYWYEDGKLLKKKNTFTDFIDCAEYLVEKKFTNSGKIFAMGGSAGGLLMGAIVNMKPGLFKGVVAQVPWVDVVTTMLDDTIPLTTSEYDEWGDPNKKEYYDYMLSYSPYDNVGKKKFPSMLVTTGLHDSQVQYWEPAKWVAKIRANRTDNNILLLHTNMEAGHGGASGRFKRYRETALEYAFMFNLLGIKE
ncbi:MAG: S9 family peptidase [Acidobacteriota bacterium]